MKKIILSLALATVCFSCASKKIQPIDEKIDVKATVGDKEIGLNDDKEGIIQESVAVEDELRKITWQNYETERKLKAEREDLIRCRTDLADPRLSGNKKLEPIPELEVTEDLSKVQQKLGLTENGRIKVVKKQYLTDKIEKENRYQESLDRLLSTITKFRGECERELGYVRVQHGLPSQRYQSQGYYGSEGNFIITRPAEKNLDDAFKILADQTRKGKAQEKEQSKQDN